MNTAIDSSNRRYVVISADTHGGVKPAAYRDHLEPKYRSDFDDWLKNVYPEMERGFNQTVAQATEAWGVDEEGTHLDAFLAPMDYGVTDDPGARVRALEADGIVGSVIYSAASALCFPPFFDGMAIFGTTGKVFPRDYQVAGLRAYNRWLADFCAAYPNQLKGMVHGMDYANLDEAIRLIEESAEGLRGGIMLPALNLDRPGLHEPHWDRLWSVCEEYDLPVNCHAGFMVDPRVFGSGDQAMNGMLAFASSETFNRLPLAIFILGGVLDRHPSLKLVFSEQYADWIPSVVDTMQERMREGFGMDAFRSRLKHDPRTYWERNCAVAATFMTRKEAQMRHEIGLPTIMWGSDFPHPEGTYPHTQESLRMSFSDVPPDDLALILGGNAARIYGFDLDALGPIADRVGPSVGELSTPLAESPKGYRRFSLRPSEDRDLVLPSAAPLP